MCQCIVLSLAGMPQGVERATGRVVAVKIIPKNMPTVPRVGSLSGDDSHRPPPAAPASPRVPVSQRLQREIATQRRMGRHPNICPLLEVFSTEDMTYLVLPYLSGGNLLQKVAAEGPLPPELAAKYLRQIATALQYLHSRDCVHRDLKPENVMLSDTTPSASIRIIDFGLASASNAEAVSRMHTVCGTWVRAGRQCSKRRMPWIKCVVCGLSVLLIS